MNVTPGTRLGRYEVRGSLGAGGMGEVYLAYDPELEREVAVKILRDSVDDSAARVRRFVQEAKAASALNHPNVAHVYEIGSQDDLRFIAMEKVEGETLRQRMSRGPLPIDDALSLAMQIAAGLAAAHQAGIVHRDVKPENVIIRPDGYAKVLDFGLAKLRELRSEDAATLLKTRPGLGVGTLGYMAPEQFSGGEVTPAADVFSLGVVLYEMISGRRPFEGTTAAEVLAAILTKTPRPIMEERADIPPKLASVISKAMTRDAEERYPSAGELLEELRQISHETMEAAIRSADAEAAPVRFRPRLSRRTAIVTAGVLLLAIAAAAVWMKARSNRLRGAMDSIATAEGFLKQRAYPEAYQAAIAAATILPQDQRVRDVIAASSDKVEVESDPPGATVYLQRFKGPSERSPVGTTPLIMPQVPGADYLVTLEKPGYAPATRTISTLPIFYRGALQQRPTAELQVTLLPASEAPPGMVFVKGSEYRLAGWSRPSDRVVKLDDFFIDRYEVSNREFEQFVRAGGYRHREFWKHPFVDAGKTLSFDEAMRRFRDTTGLPGPRTWSSGAPAPGRENHPVTDVTWYEAAAFAEWKGKKLPSIYQFEKAARHPVTSAFGSSLPWGIVGEGVDATERANFNGKGTMPVDTMPFGISPWGAHHMAGNVSEWCRNPKQPGFAIRGGSWNDPVYSFGVTGGYPGFYSSATVGFRCVKERNRDGADQGAFALSQTEFVPVYRPVGDREFAEIRRRYQYDRVPLDARVLQTVETPNWRREKIAYTVAGKTVLAYLYLPTGFRRPLQLIYFVPASDVAGGLKTLPASIESALPPFIRSGRAVFGVVLEGYLERPRPAGFVLPDSRSAEFAEYVVGRVTEQRRGLDYLESRPDIDGSRIGFFAPSAGSWGGLILAAVETRFRSVAFSGTGIRAREVGDIAVANRINFAPRVPGPKLMLHGRYDESAPVKSEAEPLFRLLRDPKRLEIYDGGHAPPAGVAIPILQSWFDQTLGPVEQ
jgi:formylglycine-generating enzyme required for sulfatase activity/tRNA A-37 threonylcarbamoyl transferase component Bud32